MRLLVALALFLVDVGDVRDARRACRVANRHPAAFHGNRINLYVAPDVPFGWFDAPPSLNRLLGVQWLARLLHPTLFPEPLAPVVKAFHERDYHRTPTDAQVQDLVRESGLAR